MYPSVESPYRDRYSATAVKSVFDRMRNAKEELEDANAELRKLKDALRWRDVRVEPLPSDGNELVEIDFVAKGKRLHQRAAYRVHYCRLFGCRLWWRPLTPGPTAA